MTTRWNVRLALAASIGLGAAAGLLRGQVPAVPPLPPIPAAAPAPPTTRVVLADAPGDNPLGLTTLTPGSACAPGGGITDLGPAAPLDKAEARPHINSSVPAPVVALSPADGYDYSRLTPEAQEALRARKDATSCIGRWWRRRMDSQCWSHHNSFLCGSCESELRFVFGSCRQFFGEPCLAGPERYPYSPPAPFAQPYRQPPGAAPFPYAPPYSQVGGDSGCRSCR